MCNLSSNAMLKTVILFALPWIAYAYENIALHKNAWQLHPFGNQNFRVFLSASNAVDGLKTNLSFIGGQCTQSGNGQYEAMWRVDLGAVLGINHITLYYKTENILWGPNNWGAGRFLGFSVYVSNTTDRKDGILCFKDDYFTKYTIPAVLTLNCTHHGRYVIYYNNRTSKNRPPDYSYYAWNELCEFEVYGCPVPDHYGKNCNQTCSSRCKDNRCHIETGYCLDCENGYWGPYCKEPKEISRDDSNSDPSPSSTPLTDETEFSPLTGKLNLKVQTPGTQQTVVNQPTIATTEQPRQASTSPISKTFHEKHSFGGKHNVYDSQSELFVAEIEKLKLEMEYIKLLTKKVSSEIEILELKKKSLSANCTALSSSKQQ